MALVRISTSIILLGATRFLQPEYPYLQVRLNEPKNSLLFSMISCEWSGTCDTPEDMEVLVTNTPNDENSWKSVKEFSGIVTGSGQQGAHP